MIHKLSRTPLGLAMVLTLILAACSDGGGTSAAPSTAAGVTGSIVVSGSSTVEPITSLVAEDFAAQNADFDFTVDGPGTGDGFALFCNGETDISDASRPTYDSFLEIVFGDIAEARETDEVARPDYTASADDNVIIEGIGGTATSLGWVGFAFYEENADAVKAIEVDGGDGCVAPTAETISSNEYPISRDLFIYVNTDAAAENESVSAFVDYFLSDEGMAAVDEAGYVSLTAELLDETRAAWEGR